MYVLLEHGGSEASTKYANKLSEELQELYEAVVEIVVSNIDDCINLYNDDFKLILQLPIGADFSILDYYL